MKYLMIVALLLLLALPCVAAENWAVSIVGATNPGSIVWDGSYRLHDGGSLDVWADLMFCETDDAWGIGGSVEYESLLEKLPMIGQFLDRGGFALFWVEGGSLKGRLYLMRKLF